MILNIDQWRPTNRMNPYHHWQWKIVLDSRIKSSLNNQWRTSQAQAYMMMMMMMMFGAYASARWIHAWRTRMWTKHGSSHSVSQWMDEEGERRVAKLHLLEDRSLSPRLQLAVRNSFSPLSFPYGCTSWPPNETVHQLRQQRQWKQANGKKRQTIERSRRPSTFGALAVAAAAAAASVRSINLSWKIAFIIRRGRTKNDTRKKRSKTNHRQHHHHHHHWRPFTQCWPMTWIKSKIRSYTYTFDNAMTKTWPNRCYTIGSLHVVVPSIHWWKLLLPKCDAIERSQCHLPINVLNRLNGLRHNCPLRLIDKRVNFIGLEQQLNMVQRGDPIASMPKQSFKEKQRQQQQRRSIASDLCACVCVSELSGLYEWKWTASRSPNRESINNGPKWH